MHKKIFVILTFLVFLMVSISVISAEPDEIQDDSNNDVSKVVNVRIDWNDDGQTADRPDSITVKLLHDGKVVDSIKLNEDNSWNASFKITDDGSYEIGELDEISSYSTSLTGNIDDGFVITNTIKETPLRASENDDIAADDSLDDISEEADNSTDDESQDDVPEEADNSTDDNLDDDSVDNETDDSNQTDNQNDTPEENHSVVVSKTPTKTTIKEQKIVKKEDKPVKKNDTNTTKNKLKNTGLPIVALVLVLFIVAIIPISRRKK